MLTSDKIKFEFNFIDPCICNSWVAAAIGGSALIGGAASIFSANKAVDAQTNATNRAIQQQQQMYDTTRADLAPYRAIGTDAYGTLKSRLAELTSPISINPNDLENSDYYQFASTQGQKAVTNSAAARGLGKSGAALKGAATFAKGLATDTYKTAFDMANINQTNAYQRLLSLIQVGAGAATGTGAAGQNTANQISSSLTGQGNAQAAGANSIGGSIASIANNIGGYAAYKGLYGTPSGSGTGNFNYAPAPGTGYMPVAA